MSSCLLLQSCNGRIIIAFITRAESIIDRHKDDVDENLESVRDFGVDAELLRIITSLFAPKSTIQKSSPLPTTQSSPDHHRHAHSTTRSRAVPHAHHPITGTRTNHGHAHEHDRIEMSSNHMIGVAFKARCLIRRNENVLLFENLFVHRDARLILGRRIALVLALATFVLSLTAQL